MTPLPLDHLHLRLLRDYDQPGRHYHGVHHVLELLELYASGETRGIRIDGYRRPNFPRGVETALIDAIVAHDAVYEIGRPKGWNEEQSYRRCVEVRGEENFFLKPMIDVTIHHDPDQIAGQLNRDMAEVLMPAVRLMSDLDMSPLGADPEVFEDNSDNLRREFLHGGVHPKDYLAGRIAFLTKTLERERIYHTDLFHEALENTARNNMARAIADATGLLELLA